MRQSVDSSDASDPVHLPLSGETAMSGHHTSEPSRLFDELVTVARMLGAEVRLESFSTQVTPGGGLCRLSGRALILIDREAPVSLRIDALARALSRFEIDQVYMTPEARETVELHTANSNYTA